MVSGHHHFDSQADRRAERVNVRLVGQAEVDDQLISLISCNELGHDRIASSHLDTTSVAARAQLKAPEGTREADGNRSQGRRCGHAVREGMANQRPNDEPRAQEDRGESDCICPGQHRTKGHGHHADRQWGHS
jgi:hypothetical protein